MDSYRELKVWELAMDLSVECYRVTRGFPKEELFGLTSQIRRASASIPANIAEGWGRQSTAEYIRFLRIAHGSLKELETHLHLSFRVGLLRNDQFEVLDPTTESVGRMLNALIRSLQSKRTPNS